MPLVWFVVLSVTTTINGHYINLRIPRSQYSFCCGEIIDHFLDL